MLISVNINGEMKKIDVEPDDFLADVLRKYGYLSVKVGCDTGACGICTVWVDNQPILSCSELAVRVDGKSVTTLEGVQEDAEIVGRFLVNEGAEQCGFCSPGLIMTILAMKQELSNPTEEDVKHYLNGNLCRCTGYAGHLRAIMKYLKEN